MNAAGSGLFFLERCRVRAVTIGTTDVITPMFTAAEIIVAFLAGMAGQASFRDRFRILAFE